MGIQAVAVSGKMWYQKLLQCLFICSHVSFVALQDGKAVEFPTLPNYYTATLMYNVANKERFNIRTCRLTGNCSPRSDLPPEHALGKSFSIVETMDDRTKSAFLIIESEFAMENGTQEMIREKIVWNAQISGVKNVIQHSTFAGRDSCLADNTTESSVLDWLFGFNPNCTTETDPEDCPMPSVGSMLHAVGDYAWDSCQTIRGVKTNLFTTNWHIDAWNADLAVKYYWSDQLTWQSTAGTGNPAPIRCELEGSAVDPVGQETIFIQETIDFMDFLEVEPDPWFFQPPRDMFCEGRAAENSLPAVPNYYQYGSELVFHHKSPETGIIHKIISPRQNWYDHDMQLARVDYKPIDFGRHGNVFAGRRGVQTDIQDFMGGVAYQIDKSVGNCTVVPLKDDNAGDLEIVGGRIQMSDPMHMFHMDQKFAYNGEYFDRGIKMGHFVASKPAYEGSDFIWNTLVALSAPQYLIQDDGTGERMVPAKITTYPKMKYNDIHQWVTTNIYGFSKSKEQFQSYDITPCFEEDHKMNLLVKMSWRMDMDLMAIKEFQRFARAKIAVIGNITPLRVQQIEVIVEPGASSYDLIFTIVDGVELIDIGVELPEQVTRPLKDVKQSLEAAVDARTFVISVPENNGGSQGSVNSTASKLIGIDARPGAHSKPDPHVSYVKGYTSGDMAGLAFGMIFGGFLLAGSIYFFALRNNVRAGIPVMRGFDNPLQGLTNLV